MTDSRKAASAARRKANRARGKARDYERVRARAVLPNTRVMITRRCHDRRFFLSAFGDPRKGHTPEETSNFYGYTVARAVKKYGALFHGGVQMGDHHHNNITDRLGNRPGYKNSVHGNLARGLNARFGRFDSVWSGGGSCDTVTPSDDKTLEDMAYSDCNPQRAGLVKWGYLWPGFTTYGWRFGETRVFKRPDWYYDPKKPDSRPIYTSAAAAAPSPASASAPTATSGTSGSSSAASMASSTSSPTTWPADKTPAGSSTRGRPSSAGFSTPSETAMR